ncbi:inositol monophosphatase family protein [Saccharicrinis sp. FJH54]|uniref:inositol monophosphatase family protein n=1 Tax=Saccharicrinis sp. FJH54 TaxID=3344665 RepID=UPI0035D4D145
MNEIDDAQVIETIKGIHFKIVKEISNKVHSNYNPNIISEDIEVGGDISYDIDVKAESIIIDTLSNLKGDYSITLVMEGLGEKEIRSGNGKGYKIIFDPIDGTREIMYDKRSAWILTGISEISSTSLKNINVAIQTEIPTKKQDSFSFLIGIRNKGSFEEIYSKSTFNLVSSKKRLKTSDSEQLKDGFVCFPNPFPGTKIQIAKSYETFYKKIFPKSNVNDAKVFSDEYISSGGQIYLLASGRYRIVADIRAFVQNDINSLCCHPYDICTGLIATEAGAILIDLKNNRIEYPLDTATNCDWIGFSNYAIYEKYCNELLESITKD